MASGMRLACQSQQSIDPSNPSTCHATALDSRMHRLLRERLQGTEKQQGKADATASEGPRSHHHTHTGLRASETRGLSIRAAYYSEALLFAEIEPYLSRNVAAKWDRVCGGHGV